MTDQVQNIMEFNPALTHTSSVQAQTTNTDLLKIGEELRSKIENNKNEKEIISQEQYTYNNMKGLLQKFSDGSVLFLTKQKMNGTDVIYQYKFKNENDLSNKKPSQQVINPGKENKITVNYEYYRNGKVKRAETKNAKDVTIREEEYNKDGKLGVRKIYDAKSGNLKKIAQFKYNKDNSVDAEVYDEKNVLLETFHTQYADDMKTKISEQGHYTNGQLKSNSKYDSNGKIQSKEEYYENGEIKSKTEYWDNGVIKRQEKYDETGKITSTISPEVDGNFGLSRQVGEGDCYLMSTINSIRGLDNGQQMLKDLVKVETNSKGEKVYVVTFPGAKLTAEGLKTDSRVDPNKVHVTGEYRFTEAEFQEILKQAGKRYSIGDGDVILLEAAFEKYRQEVKQTLDDNPKLTREIGTAGTVTGTDYNNILYGGQPEDATFILTGKQSNVYVNSHAQFGLDLEVLQTTGEPVLVRKQSQISTLEKSAPSEVDGGYTSNTDKLNEMLDRIMTDGNDGHIDLIATAGFTTIDDKGKPGGHALTIKSVTKDTVTLINPWHPDKEITMSREDFIKSCTRVTVSDSSTQHTSSTPTSNQTTSTNQTNQTSHTNQTNTQHPTNPQNPTNPSEATGTTTVEVKRGDNLWKIAKKHLGGNPTATQIANYVNKIMKANPGLSWSGNHSMVMIHPGDKIILP